MLVVLNSTITGNYAVEYTSACPTCYPGVGIGGLARSGSSIVVGNFMLDPAGPHFDISGHHGPTSMSFGHNVIGTSYGPFTPAAGDQLGVTPEQVKLGPLQNNGGPTDTIAVGCFGVAIDAGSGGSLANDQRGSGFPRVFGASADVGAFERQNGCAPSTLIVNTTGDGSNLTGETNCDADPAPGLQCTLRAAMELANLSPGHDIDFAIPPSEPNCNASGQCVIDLTRRLPDIMEALEINGPGASQLTVRRDTSAATYFPIFTIRAAGNFHISGLTVSGGTGTGPFQDGRSGDGQGGGIYLYAHNAIVNVTRCVIAGNGFVQPGLYGPYGGIVSGLNTAAGEFVNTLNVVDTVVRDNAGAGIRASPAGIVNVKNSTISGNDGGNNAGGVSGGTVDVTNSTVTGNSSVFTGGISGGNVAITNSTIVQNIKTGHCCAGPHAGGVSVAQATIRSSIVALNTNADTFTPPYPDVKGNFTSEGYNIIGSTFGATIGPSAGDQFGVTAAQLALGPLQDNGGPAYTMLPGPGSVAIDQGRAGSLVIDQRGLPRPYDNPLIPNALGGDGSDVGAVEVTPDNDGDGMIDPFDPDDDNDGVTDDLDAFPLDPTETGDHDSDAIGNNADPDDDNDLVDDNLDAFPFDAGESSDNDGDGVGNNADTDDDNDGVADGVDNCPLMVNQNQADFDLDGIGDTCDPQTGPPVNKDQCKNNGWRRFDFPAFSNQGQCIKYVNAH